MKRTSKKWLKYKLGKEHLRMERKVERDRLLLIQYIEDEKN